MISTDDLRFDERVAAINDVGGSVTGEDSNAEAAHAVAEEIRQRGGEADADSHCRPMIAYRRHRSRRH